MARIMPHPTVVLLAGPNGAGKTTASVILQELGVTEFLNADDIARREHTDDPYSVESALDSGRVLLARIDELLERRRSFAVETTLASRTHRTNLLRKCQDHGVRTCLLFLGLPSPELSIVRVALRVRHGGHPIQPDVIERRFRLGLKYFFDLYESAVDFWMLFDNSSYRPHLVALGGKRGTRTTVADEPRLHQFEAIAGQPARKREGALHLTEEPAQLIEKLIGMAIDRAVSGHHYQGRPITVWRDGRPVLLLPDGTQQAIGTQELQVCRAELLRAFQTRGERNTQTGETPDGW